MKSASFLVKDSNHEPETGNIVVEQSSNLSSMSWFDLARGYCRYQVGGHHGEMGQRLCNYVEQGFFSGAPQPTATAALALAPLDLMKTTREQLMKETIESGFTLHAELPFLITGSCSQSLTKIPVPYSEYTKTLLDKLDENKNIQLSEEEKADADLEALASNYKNNIQYEKETLSTKLEFCTSNLDSLNMIVFRESQPEVTSCEDATLDKITRHINVLKSKRNNQTGEDTTLAEELTADLDKFKSLIATLSKVERAEFTFLIASVGKIIRKMEILTPLLDAYIFIFLIRNSTTSDRSLKHIHDLLAFLGKHSMQLRLEPELTRLIEITVQTKLIEELNNAATAVMRGETILTWKSTFDSSTQLKATQLLQSGTYILNKISAVQKAVLVADLVWVEELTKAYNEALRKLVNCLSKFGKKIQNTVEVQTRVKHSLVLPVLMGATYFAVGFMQGR